tara:strand:- start:228 stop:440 length:213 start_codon:yes stop_codon:yes gene_type:complete
MRILNKSEKKVYNQLLSMIQFKNIDCNNIPIPKGWLNNIKDLKINEDLKSGFMFKGKRFKRVGWKLYIEQ